MRLAFIGCGRRARQDILPLLAEVSGSLVVAFVDPDPNAARCALEQVRKLGLSLSARPLVLAADHELPADATDAVIIASPHVYHYNQARHWLRRGKPVFVEKPLACRPVEAALLLDAFHVVGLTVCDPRRFRPDLLKAGRLVESGVIGPLRSVRYEDFVRRPDDFAESWRNDLGLAGGGVLLDLGCHTLGTLLRICARTPQRPEVESVRLRRGGYQVEVQAEVRLHIPPGIEAEVVVGLTENAASGFEELVLAGETGAIRLRRDRGGNHRSFLRITSGGDSHSVAVPVETGFDGESLKRFLRGPREVDMAGLRAHLATLSLISEAYEKAGLGSSQPETTEACLV